MGIAEFFSDMMSACALSLPEAYAEEPAEEPEEASETPEEEEQAEEEEEEEEPEDIKPQLEEGQSSLFFFSNPSPILLYCPTSLPEAI